MAATAPDFKLESAALARGYGYVCGIDEVGRGPLAGPVTAAAVRLDPANIPHGLNDSKRLSAKRRRVLSAKIHATAQVSIAHASVKEIDQINILQAAHLAMKRAVAGLEKPVDFALIDGNRVPIGFPINADPIVKGDTLSWSISAASIVAKVCRDRIMVGLAQQHPGYGWETNAGYATRAHLEALRHLGVTPHHRRSFAPVHNMLYQDKSVTD